MSTDACLDAAIRMVGKSPFFDGGRFVTPAPLQPWHTILPRIFPKNEGEDNINDVMRLTFPRFKKSFYPNRKRK